MTSPEATQSLCAICMEPKTPSEMFENTKACGHLFSTNCIREYIASKLNENVTMVKYPDLTCEEVIGPQDCESVVPKEVLGRWESIMFKSLIMGSENIFKDCSAMMVGDGGVAGTTLECPSCNRLFCMHCKVVWHYGMSCGEFEIRKKGESNIEDNCNIYEFHSAL